MIWRGGPRWERLADLPTPRVAGRIAIFVPAWDEEAVIGGMLSAALDRYDHPDYRLYVGVYCRAASLARRRRASG